MITAEKLSEAFFGDDVPEDEHVEKWLEDRKEYIDSETFNTFWKECMDHHGFAVSAAMLASFQITFDLMIKELKSEG